MKIARIGVWKIELPLVEGSYKWSGGRSVEVFDSTLVRVETDDGCTGFPSCTVETSLSVGMPCSNGSCAVSQNYPHAFLPVGLEGTYEVVGVEVIDANDDVFATQGVLVDLF